MTRLQQQIRFILEVEIDAGDTLHFDYANRQQQLARAGELFAAALAEKQAVILLDGLDEVQARRQHLVRRVQDFVAEYIPAPSAPPAMRRL